MGRAKWGLLRDTWMRGKCKIIYGEDLLAALPVRDYLKRMSEPATAQKAECGSQTQHRGPEGADQLQSALIPRSASPPSESQRRTCRAPGLTILVGVPLMKFTTLSKAVLK